MHKFQVIIFPLAVAAPRRKSWMRFRFKERRHEGFQIPSHRPGHPAVCKSIALTPLGPNSLPLPLSLSLALWLWAVCLTPPLPPNRRPVRQNRAGSCGLCAELRRGGRDRVLLRQARDVPRGGLRHGNLGHLGLRHKARQKSWLKHRTCSMRFRCFGSHMRMKCSLLYWLCLVVLLFASLTTDGNPTPFSRP